MAVGDSFLQMLEGLDSYYGDIETHPQDPFLHWEQITENYEVLPSELENTVDLLPQGEVIKNADGSIRSYNIATEVSSDLDLASELNSNVQPTKTTLNIPSNTTVDGTTGNVVATTGVAGGAAAGAFAANSKKLFTGLVAVGIASTIGKLILPDLYNDHPNFFGDLEIGGMDGETWNKITQKEENEEANRWFHGLLKSNGDKTGTFYIDQDVYTYIIKYMIEQGVFNTEEHVEGSVLGIDIVQPFYASHNAFSINYKRPFSSDFREMFETFTCIEGDCFFTLVETSTTYRIVAASLNQFKVHYTVYDSGSITRELDFTGTQTTNHGYTFYYSFRDFRYQEYPKTYYESSTISPDAKQPDLINYVGSEGVAYAIALLFGEFVEGGGVEGIEQQEGGITPTFTNDDSYADILAKLKEIYPDWDNKSITQNVVQPDGSTKTYVYVPVVIPEILPGTETETEPEIKYITGTQTQTKTIVEVETVPEEVIETVVKVVKETEKVNVVDETGEGETPPIVIPTGSASALYTVYNPTNGEINSFGSWLWSSNFVDQLLKMFNDPMQAIISLHKVFCSPSVSGRDTIKVGYLDSGVDANVVSGQYVTVNCGSVNLAEQYQSVFDYPPFTDVTLYLPFVGFVRLDTNDVMRGTINVTYHIDVLTGSCLAEVSVTRDMFGGVIYQYSGDCSVHYPLSSGSYMGIVSALLGVAGTVASGGTLAPMAIGVAAGAMRGHANVERSGSLSGNAGAMGIKKPYLVIQRPQINTPSEFEKFMGKPSNSLVTIGECTGYIKCKEVHVLNTPATESETQELVSLLKEGVIL